ncbi:class III lanthipeptide [Bacillus pacificus]|nr:class III lanthipeptide [Bacillus cereus]MBL3858807.1 class III lanthipeptide [Bacillus cereus]HDR7969887.1 class III lanthipeptide [Bacillus pacificus]
MKKILNLQKSIDLKAAQNNIQSNLSIGCKNRSNLSLYFC